MPPTAGTVTLNGRGVTRLKGAQLREYWREVQAVFQDPFSAFNQFFSVRRLLARSRRLLGGEQAAVAERMTAALEQVGLQRDVLDASLRANILDVLVDLRRDTGPTVLFITHDIGQACYVSDRVLVMQHGRLVESGPTEDVTFRPTHDYTRRLLADVPRLHDLPS